MFTSTETIIILGSAALAYFLGIVIARQLRMKEHGWRLATIFACATLGATIASFGEPKAGIDLRGGVILNYQVDEDRTAEAAEAEEDDPYAAELPPGASTVDMDALIQSLKRRIDPSGVREMVLRQYGGSQVEIIIPEASSSEVERIKQDISETGFLKFRIVADRQRNPRVWEAGELALASADEKISENRFVRDGERTVGEWVALGKEDPETTGGEVRYRVNPAGMLIRELNPGNKETLVLVDEDFQVEGKHLRGVQEDFDPETASPCVTFQATPEGAALFGSLTGMNLPDKQANSYAKLGIVMDDILLSAPVIQSRITSNGQITGRFTKVEVERLVRILRAGRLPAVLEKVPISQATVSPLLGEDTIRKGQFAITGSLVAVLIFMLVYYQFAGIVACVALAINLCLIYAMMVLFKAAFTLPGLAGLVLTVGMSVDANVLIFERIREELTRGAALRMAIRNGFARATTTIVDANVTTLITAMILYAIGTEQIKSFAVTLILGIMMSMFTAIFCSRVFFDIAERKGWISKLRMSRLIGETKFRFTGMRGFASIVSAVVILIGMSGVVMRGSKILDIDFTGGTSVQCLLDEPLQIADVRSRVADIADDVAVTGIKTEEQTPETVYKIDTSLESEQELKDRIQTAMTSDSGGSLLQFHELEFTAPQPLSGNASVEPPTNLNPMIALAGMTGILQEDGESSAQPQADTASDSAAESAPPAPADSDASPAESTTADANTEETADAETTVYRSQTTLTFDEAVNARTIENLIQEAANKQSVAAPEIDFSAEGWDGKSEHSYNEWTLKFSSEPEATANVLSTLKTTFEAEPVWLSANKIGGKIAGDMRMTAVTAMLLSLVAIVAYIWIRFQHITFGLAAVIALVHDVLVTLGAVALSFWIAKFAGFLLIEEFKISLPIVAAFLTVIGYSLNDTIVVFDRIREVKGKSPELTAEMIDTSINQTLSRTLLTSITTLIVVVILYMFGGDGIHGFAFALLVGVVVGTYSSIFVASPALLWLSKVFADDKRPSQSKRGEATAAR